MFYEVFRDGQEYERYLQTLSPLERAYLSYLREKERRREHWKNGGKMGVKT
ncbi:hypothetical protein J4210_04965 [Candidatus Woesearchaeota archaeon]|nr:hypothetical protein [Candidatus Woesearchaeota archaeon]